MCFKYYVQVAGGTQQLTLHVVLLHLDACLHNGKVKWKEAYLQKLVAACCRMRILFYSWIRQKLKMQILYDGLAKILGRLYYILNYIWELKKSVGSHGTSLLKKKIIRLRGYAHKQQKKPRTQDFTWFSKSLHPRSAPALNSHYIFQKRIQQWRTI